MTASTKAHFTAVVLGLLIVGLLTFLIVLGWQRYFSLVDDRQALAAMSKKADEEFALHAAEQAANIKASTRAATTLPASPPRLTPPMEIANATSAAKLADVVRTEDTSGFPDPVPINEDITPERRREANETLQKFWQASSWKEKSAFVADAERVGPLMRDYYEVQHNTDPMAGNSSHQAHFKLNNTEVLLFSYSSPRPSGTLDLAMIASLGAKFLVDWESYVGASELGWQEFKKQRVSKPALFRVFLNRDDYYNYEFSDEKKFLALHLASPDGFYFVKGFCERGSPIARTIESALAGSSSRVAMTLRLAFPEQALSDHCVNITGVVANRWLIVP